MTALDFKNDTCRPEQYASEHAWIWHMASDGGNRRPAFISSWHMRCTAPSGDLRSARTAVSPLQMTGMSVPAARHAAWEACLAKYTLLLRLQALRQTH